MVCCKLCQCTRCVLRGVWHRLCSLLRRKKDNSGLMLLKLLSLCECSGINVIGMDGYSYNPEENYYLNELELASSMEQVDNMNLGMQIMKKKFKEMGINFIK